MSVPFNEVPGQVNVPLTYIEFDNSRAVSGPGTQPYKTLLIGNKLDAATGEAEKLKLVSSADQVGSLYGYGSVIHSMAIKYFENNTTTETWAIALDDDSGGAKASGSLEVDTAASQDGTLFLYIGGIRMTIGIDESDDTDAIAAKIASEINDSDNRNLVVSAEVDGANASLVNLEAKNAGEHGNDIDIRFNYFSGEEFPAGLVINVTDMADGTSNPDIGDAISAAGDDKWFNLWCHPYTDTANLNTLRDHLLNLWGPIEMRDGVGITAKAGTQGDLSTFYDGLNDFLSVILGVYQYPTPPWQIAAATAGVVAFQAPIDPARPFQTLSLRGILAPEDDDKFTWQQRNMLVADGAASLTFSPDDTVLIERLVTTYTQNLFGSQDPSYRDLNTILTLSFIRWDLSASIQSRYPRHKLADDGARFGTGQPIVTPSVMKAFIVNKFDQWELLGLVNNVEQFKEDLIVERDSSDVNRLNVLMAPDLVNQLRVVAAQIQFLLQQPPV